MKLFIQTCCTITLLLIFCSIANAGIGIVENPDNGHYYEIQSCTSTWEGARDFAAARTFMGTEGHLATVSSQAENDFIFNVAMGGSGVAWLGGFQEGATAVDNGWLWVTGELFSYTNWLLPDEPNDSPNMGEELGAEDCLTIWDDGSGPGTWNDRDCVEPLASCIIEYEPTANGTPPPSGPIVIIPTMGQWGMIVATILLGFLAVFSIRRRTES